jgi:hypothetical protein
VNALTIAELRLHQADLAYKAEKKRQEQRTTPATGPRALPLAREAKAFQERADDYAKILAGLEQA